MSIQGKSITAAIIIDELDPPAPSLVYGNEWQQVMTGRGLLAIAFLKTLERVRVEILFEKPTPTKEKPIIDCDDISKLEKIPPSSTIQEVLDRLPENTWGVHISNFGFVTLKAMPFLLRVFMTFSSLRAC